MNSKGDEHANGFEGEFHKRMTEEAMRAVRNGLSIDGLIGGFAGPMRVGALVVGEPKVTMIIREET